MGIWQRPKLLPGLGYLARPPYERLIHSGKVGTGFPPGMVGTKE